MASYDILKNILQSKIYQNSAQAISGAVLQDTLTSFINTLGVNSNFMGLLSSGNKPSASVDGKQFYIGVNSGDTAINVDLTAVGCGTLSITKYTIFFVYSDSSGWHTVDVAAGLPKSVSSLTDGANYTPKPSVISVRGDVVIDKVESNKIYEITECYSLEVQDYEYVAYDDSCLVNAPTYMVIHTAGDFTINTESLSRISLASGSSLTLEPGNTYLVTVHGYFWKVELYS